MNLKRFNPFRKTYTQKQLVNFRFFSKVNLFKDLSFEEMDEILPNAHLRQFQKNEAIFFRNDPSQALYILKDGTVELNIDMKDSFEVLGEVRRFVSIGNNALIKDSKRHYNAIVTSDEAKIFVIPQVNLMEIFHNNKKIEAKMLSAFVRILDGTNQALFKSYQNNFGFFNLGEAYTASDY